MLKLILADDEPLVLVGLQSMLKWEEHGIQIVGTAHNGARALELIEAQQPDIVITDIKMPVMDGLQLMRASQKKYRRLPLFILLTSYEEFSFVKEAIDCRAVDYLVKLEFTEQSLLRSIEKAKEELKAIRATQETQKRAPETGLDMQPFCDRFFIRLFNNLFEDEEQFLLQSQELGIDFSFGAYAVCRCELLENRAGAMEAKQLMSLFSSTAQMAWETVTKYAVCCLTPLDMRHFSITFCFAQGRTADCRGIMNQALEKACDVVFSYFGVGMTCSVGSVVDRPLRLCESYYTARMCQPDARERRIVFYDGAQPDDGSNVYDMSLYKQELIKAFEEQDYEALEHAFTQIIKSLKCSPARLLQAMDAACNLLFLCLSQLTDGEEIVAQIFENEPEGYKCVYQKRSIPEITAWITELSDGLSSILKSRRRSYKDKTTDEIKEYIRANIDKRLSLNEVAAVFGFSPNYLSQLFAKQAGCSFVEYITNEKIRAAKEMMTDSGAKIYEVAEKLGFKSAFYFSKVFKKVEGCSPREYIQNRL